MPQAFVCPNHGYGVPADEDGCCVMCGADCLIETGAPPINLRRRFILACVAGAGVMAALLKVLW